MSRRVDENGFLLDDESADDDQTAEAEWRADDLVDKLSGYLACRPAKATREEVVAALHEWFKAHLALHGAEKKSST